jgi:DNA-binding CsgD family transcriptional regulator
MKASPSPKLEKISATETTKLLASQKLARPWSPAGILLLDSSLNPVSFNAEAIQILSFPEKPANLTRPHAFLSRKIRSNLISGQFSGQLSFVNEFRSGRRHYFCRVFLADSNANDRSQPSIAVLLERVPSDLTSLARVAQQFHLTPREREALECLLQNLTSKEIAKRMNVSPNTVKVFLRLIMTKMGVSSRSAIVVKILMLREQ